MSDQISIVLGSSNQPYAVLKAVNNSRGSSYLPNYSPGGSTLNMTYPQHIHLMEEPQLHTRHNIRNNIINTTMDNGRYLEFNKILENTRITIVNLLNDYPTGIYSSQLKYLITNKTQREFDPKHFGCPSIIEFVLRYIKPKFDIEVIPIISNESPFLIRSREALKKYNYLLQQQRPMSNLGPSGPLHYKFESYPRSLANSFNLPDHQPYMGHHLAESMALYPESLSRYPMAIDKLPLNCPSIFPPPGFTDPPSREGSVLAHPQDMRPNPHLPFAPPPV